MIIIIIRPNNNNTTYQIVDFVAPEDNWVNIKESEKRDMYLDFAREL